MRYARFIALALGVLAFAAPAAAQDRWSISFLGGYQRAQKVVFSTSSTSGLGAVSGPTFEIDVHAPLKSKVEWLVGVTGFTTDSFVAASGALVTLNTRNFSIENRFRFFTRPGDQPRGFLEVGPTINFVKGEASATVVGLPVDAAGESSTKIGLIFGGGGQLPINKRFSGEFAARYAWLPKMGELNFSHLKFLGGINIKLGS